MTPVFDGAGDFGGGEPAFDSDFFLVPAGVDDHPATSEGGRFHVEGHQAVAGEFDGDGEAADGIDHPGAGDIPFVEKRLVGDDDFDGGIANDLNLSSAPIGVHIALGEEADDAGSVFWGLAVLEFGLG